MTRQLAKESPAGAEMETSHRPFGPEPPAQCQDKKTVNHSSANAATARALSNNLGSAALSSQKERHTILTYRAHDRDILYRELQQNYPNERWFDSYDSFDKRLRHSKGRSKNTENIQLADLTVLVGVKNGVENSLGLQEAVRDTISYLLDIEADWNPITAINSQPQGCSSALWKGQLWLGGIKDSVNREGVLEKCGISAVVSIHPKDWLAEDSWEKLFARWNGDPSSLQPGWTHDKSIGQYLIELEDNSSSDLLSYFEKAFKFLDYYLLQGKNALVHCKMGQSRSASLVLGYMVYRYYKLGMHMAGKAPSANAFQNFERPENVLRRFTEDISIPPDEPNRTAARTTTTRRRGINTEKFEPQLLQYFNLLSQGQSRHPAASEPIKQPEPMDKKAGGGIIKEAILVLCFLHDLKPTREILSYWSAGSKINTTHYWIEASKDKSGKEDIGAKDHLGLVDEFFASYLKQ